MLILFYRSLGVELPTCTAHVRIALDRQRILASISPLCAYLVIEPDHLYMLANTRDGKFDDSWTEEAGSSSYDEDSESS